MVTELYQNTVSQCAKKEKCSKYHSLIFYYISRTLKGFQELELFFNSICRGLNQCNVFYLTNRDVHNFCSV